MTKATTMRSAPNVTPMALNDHQWNRDAQAAALVARCATYTLVAIADLDRRNAAHLGVIADGLAHAACCQELAAELYAQLRRYNGMA